MKDLHMDDLQLGWSDLRELMSRAEVRGEIQRRLFRGRRRTQPPREGVERDGGSVAGPAASSVSDLDTSRALMTFPCNLTIRLRSGRTIELDGQERGGSGRPVEEQRAVVEQKCILTGVEETAWTAA
jgi:hypothetical protein